MKVRNTLCIATWILILMFSVSASAQSFMMQNLPENKVKIGIRFLRPQFKPILWGWKPELASLSGAYDLNIQIPVSKNISLVGNIPLVVSSVEGLDDETGLGNIYAGIRIHPYHEGYHTISGSYGVALPTASDDKFSATLIGLSSNYYELPKMLPDMVTVYGNVEYKFCMPLGLMFGIEVGPTVTIPTAGANGESEIYLHYGLAAGVHLSYAAIFAEWTGIGILTEDIDTFDDRFIHAITIGTQMTQFPVRPGIFYKFYTDDDMDEIIKGVFGMKVDVVI